MGVILVERLESRNGIPVEISELENRPYDLIFDAGWVKATYSSKRPEELKNILNWIENLGRIYICPSGVK